MADIKSAAAEIRRRKKRRKKKEEQKYINNLCSILGRRTMKANSLDRNHKHR